MHTHHVDFDFLFWHLHSLLVNWFKPIAAARLQEQTRASGGTSSMSLRRVQLRSASNAFRLRGIESMTATIRFRRLGFSWWRVVPIKFGADYFEVLRCFNSDACASRRRVAKRYHDVVAY
jgi:hypothetical protein